nr:MAG TPA: hypothetical protein [Caudoviricetes sp.]
MTQISMQLSTSCAVTPDTDVAVKQIISMYGAQNETYKMN